jgi:hypothetical protein
MSHVVFYIVFSFFGDTAPFDDWEGEAFADISELLNPLPDVPAAAAGHQTNGASAAQDQILPALQLEEPLGIQDFDLDLLDGRSSSPKPDLSDLLLDPLEAVSSSSNSALRNDVMLTTGQQANVTGGHRHNHYQTFDPGFLPKEESLHAHNRCGSKSMPPVWPCYIQCWGSGSAGWIRMFLGLFDLDPFVRGTDPYPDPSLF